MAGNIRIDPETMRQRSSQFKNQAENVGQVISSMDSLLNQLQQEWEGEASRSFAERFQQLRPSFVNAQNLINEIAQSLDQSAQRMEEADRAMASGFKG